MELKSHIIIGLERLLAPFGIRVVSIGSNRVRGLDLFADLACLMDHKANPLIFDVGANNGDMACEFLQAFPGAKLVAFEPFAECYQALKARFANRTNVRIENIALGAVPGTGEMNLFTGSNMNSLLPMESQPVEAFAGTFKAIGENVGKASVKVDTFDGFVRQNSFQHLDLLKVDTQGFDYNVLKGASEALKAHRITAVLVEINFIPMYQGQASFQQIHELLDGFGYRLVDLYNHDRHKGYTSWCDACYVADSAPSLNPAPAA